MENSDAALAKSIASAAIGAIVGIDAERFRLYLDLILLSLSKSAPEAFEATMSSLGYEYRSDFALRYFGQGKAEGKAEGRSEGIAEGRMEGRLGIILKLLTSRFGPLPDAVQTLVRGAREAQLDTLAEQMLTAQTLEDALRALQ